MVRRLLILAALLVGVRAHAQSKVESRGTGDITVEVADGTSVTLVGFASDRKVSSTTQKAKAGVARFTKLDTTGKTAYLSTTDGTAPRRRAV